jgi:predicted MFS family arabinose efflux permease
MIMAFCIGMSGLSFNNLAPAFAREVMDFNAQEAGIFLMVSGIGSLVGTSMLIVFEPQRRHLVFVFLAFGFGLSVLAISLNPYYLLAFMLMAMYGLFNSTIPVLAQTVFQVVVPQDYLGRVNSMLMVAPGMAALVTLPLGVLADAVGLRLVVSGIGIFLMSATTLVSVLHLPKVHLSEKERTAVTAAASIP